MFHVALWVKSVSVDESCQLTHGNLLGRPHRMRFCHIFWNLLPQEEVMANDESKPVRLAEQMHTLYFHLTNNEYLAVAKEVEPRGPPGILDLVLPCKQSLHTGDRLPGANPWHLAIAISKLSSQVPCRGGMLLYGMGFQYTDHMVFVLSNQIQYLISSGRSDSRRVRVPIQYWVDNHSVFCDWIRHEILVTASGAFVKSVNNGFNVCSDCFDAFGLFGLSPLGKFCRIPLYLVVDHRLQRE